MATLEELARQLNEYMSQNETSVRNSFSAVADEIAALQARNATLESSSQGAFASVRQRIEGLEDGVRNGGGRREEGGKGRGLLHPKMMTPSVLSDAKQCKKWTGDLVEYCENTPLRHEGHHDPGPQVRQRHRGTMVPQYR